MRGHEAPASIPEDDVHRTREGGPDGGLGLLVAHPSDRNAGERDPRGDQDGRSRVAAQCRRQRGNHEDEDGETSDHGR